MTLPGTAWYITTTAGVRGIAVPRVEKLWVSQLQDVISWGQYSLPSRRRGYTLHYAVFYRSPQPAAVAGLLERRIVCLQASQKMVGVHNRDLVLRGLGKKRCEESIPGVRVAITVRSMERVPCKALK